MRTLIHLLVFLLAVGLLVAANALFVRWYSPDEVTVEGLLAGVFCGVLVGWYLPALDWWLCRRLLNARSR